VTHSPRRDTHGSISARDNKHSSDTYGIVKRFLAFVIRQVLAGSAAGYGQRVTIEIVQ
jgi:hypothetical protein